jgi:NAD+ diphosphatase
MSYSTIHYAGMALDRAVAERKNSTWLAAQRAGDELAVLPLWRDCNLLDRQPAAVALSGSAARTALQLASASAFLGLNDGLPIFAADLSSLDESDAQLLAGTGRFTDLRRVGALLPTAEASLLAYARGILYWHREHAHCGRCGAPATSEHGGHMRLCSNPDCAKQTFPRTDPAVIMLIELRQPGELPRCLLGRQARWPAGQYSTLAGFVDPGESLEEAVAREVFEEAGVRVESVRYRASQPWPFPSSIMLGFHGATSDPTIRVDQDELEDAQWFTAHEVRSFGEWGEGSDGRIALPRPDSISRWLIRTWLNELG